MSLTSQIIWSEPLTIEFIRDNRHLIPATSGIYVFSNHNNTISSGNGVLYVGKAKTLCKRLNSYLVDPLAMPMLSPRKKDKSLSRSLRHVGKNLLLMEIQQKSRYGDSGIWLRWTEVEKPVELEKELIQQYKPGFNIRLNPNY